MLPTFLQQMSYLAFHFAELHLIVLSILDQKFYTFIFMLFLLWNWIKTMQFLDLGNVARVVVV